MDTVSLSSQDGQGPGRRSRSELRARGGRRPGCPCLESPSRGGQAGRRWGGGGAAGELWEGAGIRSTSVAALLGDLDRGERLPERCVLVVDEAGMVATRQLAQLLDHVEGVRGKLV